MMLRSLMMTAAMTTAAFVMTGAGHASAASFDMQSALQAVTVYNNRAALTREAVVDLPAGDHILVFNNLPANIVRDSLRVQGHVQGRTQGGANARAVLGAVSFKTVNNVEVSEERLRAIMAEIEVLGDRIAVIDAEKAALDARKTFLENRAAGMPDVAGDKNAAAIAPDQWRGAGAIIQEEMAQTLKAILEKDIAARDLRKQMEKLQADANNHNRAGRKQALEVSVPVEASGAVKLTMKLSYQIGGANWRPQYEARLDSQSGALQLTQYGMVSQNTGEDWNDIELTLSTAQPHRGASLPDLETQWVGIEDGRRAMMARSAGVASFAAADMMMEAAPMPAPAAAQRVMAKSAAVYEEEAAVQAAEIQTGGLVAEYRIAGRNAVKSDGTGSKVLIAPFKMDSTLQRRVQPQTSNDAYIAAKTVLQGESVLLAGAVSLFRDDSYVGQMQMDMLRPGQERILYFGIDDQIAVKRDILKDERGQAGVIARDNVREVHYVTTIENLRAQPVDIVVQEIVPVSRDEKLRVEFIAGATTSGYKTDVDNIKGLTEWQIKAEPKKKIEIKNGLKLSWPSGADIYGF